MKNLITILLVSLSTFAFSQGDYIHTQSDYSPELQRYSFVRTYWQDTIIAHQKLFWPNGKVKVEYVQLHDSIRLRKEYFESGNLKLTAEIYQSFSLDTSYTEDVEKPGTMITKAISGYFDVVNGKYFEYGDTVVAVTITKGSFKKGTKYGEWTGRPNNYLIVINYNSNGLLDGPYFEYYYNGLNERANIKWKGQFTVVSYSYTEQQEWTLKPDQNGKSKRTESIRTGKWEHYDRAGELLENVTYEWQKK